MEVMVYGNGESRNKFDKLRFMGNYTTWGCNAIYRDLNVDNLVSVDYAMQQEIYESGYVRDNVCYFTDWSVIPNADDMLLKTMKMDFEPHMIHETLQIDRTDCVIQGKDPKTAERNIAEALDGNVVCLDLNVIFPLFDINNKPFSDCSICCKTDKVFPVNDDIACIVDIPVSISLALALNFTSVLSKTFPIIVPLSVDENASAMI